MTCQGPDSRTENSAARFRLPLRPLMLRERSCREGGRGGLIEPPQGLQGASSSILRLAGAPYQTAWDRIVLLGVRFDLTLLCSCYGVLSF